MQVLEMLVFRYWLYMCAGGRSDIQVFQEPSVTIEVIVNKTDGHSEQIWKLYFLQTSWGKEK